MPSYNLKKKKKKEKNKTKLQFRCHATLSSEPGLQLRLFSADTDIFDGCYYLLLRICKAEYYDYLNKILQHEFTSKQSHEQAVDLTLTTVCIC